MLLGLLLDSGWTIFLFQREDVGTEKPNYLFRETKKELEN